MKKLILLAMLVVLMLTFSFLFKEESVAVGLKNRWWDIQSVDTMKYSRDIARERLDDPDFDQIIDFQIQNIAELGATHVAVGTPYDPEFIPFLRRWVQAARKYGLNVWFRGNFAGWEGWFSYEGVTGSEHLRMTRDFILNNPELFEDGDIYTPCPECENGGPGDPRKTGRVSEFRQFLIDEHRVASAAFREIGKNVSSNYFSMNGDVATLVMDKETTAALGGVLVVDHYVSQPEQLERDINSYASLSGGKVLLGEIGVPIPDIHGTMTEAEQAKWLGDTLTLLAKNKNVLGVNYWVFSGGSTGLWDDLGNSREIADVLSEFYKPKKVKLRITDNSGRAISRAVVVVGGREFVSGEDGVVEILVTGASEAVVSSEGYKSYTVSIDNAISSGNVALENNRESFLLKCLRFFRNLHP